MLFRGLADIGICGDEVRKSNIRWILKGII